MTGKLVVLLLLSRDTPLDVVHQQTGGKLLKNINFIKTVFCSQKASPDHKLAIFNNIDISISLLYH